LAKDFLKKLICTDPKQRMTATQATRHEWLSRHTEELDALYDRATKDWKGREDLVEIEYFEDDLPGTPPEPTRTLPFPTKEKVMKFFHLESPDVKDSYDRVTGDGKLRNAAQLFREAKEKRLIKHPAPLPLIQQLPVSLAAVREKEPMGETAPEPVGVKRRQRGCSDGS
jgi:serine/threonine protein kinase